MHEGATVGKTISLLPAVKLPTKKRMVVSTDLCFKTSDHSLICAIGKLIKRNKKLISISESQFPLNNLNILPKSQVNYKI